MKTRFCLLVMAAWMAASVAFGAETVIRISFADSSIPDIDIHGRMADQPYGVSDTPAMARARAEVALKTPPPEYEAFALSWQPVSQLQSAVAKDGYSNYYNPYLTPLPEQATLIKAKTETLTEWAPLPLFDTELYLAEMAAWKREQVRARYILAQ